jgi:hypothetical protein
VIFWVHSHIRRIRGPLGLRRVELGDELVMDKVLEGHRIEGEQVVKVKSHHLALWCEVHSSGCPVPELYNSCNRAIVVGFWLIMKFQTSLCF